MPYRLPGRPPQPESPDVDENLLRRPWSAHALLLSLVNVPFLAWWLVMVEGGNGPRAVSLTSKIAIAVAFAIWLVIVLIFRARHERALRAAVARMEQQTEEQTSRLRIADEPAASGELDEREPDEESEPPPRAKRQL
jgi:hypothetical protein